MGKCQRFGKSYVVLKPLELDLRCFIWCNMLKGDMPGSFAIWITLAWGSKVLCISDSICKQLTESKTATSHNVSYLVFDQINMDKYPYVKRYLCWH